MQGNPETACPLPNPASSAGVHDRRTPFLAPTGVFGFPAFLRIRRDEWRSVFVIDVVNQNGECFHTLRLTEAMSLASRQQSDEELVGAVEAMVRNAWSSLDDA